MYRDAQESDDGDPDKRIIYLNAWRRAWQPTPVFLPEGSRGQRSLAGATVHGVTKSDMTEATYACRKKCKQISKIK